MMMLLMVLMIMVSVLFSVVGVVMIDVSLHCAWLPQRLRANMCR